MYSSICAIPRLDNSRGPMQTVPLENIELRTVISDDYAVLAGIVSITNPNSEGPMVATLYDSPPDTIALPLVLENCSLRWEIIPGQLNSGNYLEFPIIVGITYSHRAYSDPGIRVQLGPSTSCPVVDI